MDVFSTVCRLPKYFLLLLLLFLFTCHRFKCDQFSHFCSICHTATLCYRYDSPAGKCKLTYSTVFLCIDFSVAYKFSAMNTEKKPNNNKKIYSENCQNCPLIWMSQLSAIIALCMIMFRCSVFRNVKVVYRCVLLEWWVIAKIHILYIFVMCSVCKAYNERVYMFWADCYFPYGCIFQCARYNVPDVTCEWILLEIMRSWAQFKL